MENIKENKISYLSKNAYSQISKKIERMELDLRTIKRIVDGIVNKSRK